MRRWVLVLALLLSFALVPLAEAQQPSCALSLNPAEENETGPFSPDEPRQIAFVVENNGNFRATGDLVVLTSPPSAWDWTTQPQPVDVAQGGSQTVPLSVTFTGGSDADADLRVHLRDVECPTALAGAGLDGEVTSEPINLTLSPAAVGGGTPVEEGPGLLPWVVFGVVVLGTAVAIPVYYQRNRVAVEAFCEEPEREVVAGRGTSFPVVLRNKGNDPAHVSLDVSEVQEGWSALTTLPDLELGPKESRTLYMMVRAPEDARAGDLCVTKLEVRPEGGQPETVTTVSRVVEATKAPKTE